MEALVNAVSEFLAALFARFGYVGRARRRGNIRDELELLMLLRDSPAYGTESSAARTLSEYITGEVERYAGVEPKTKIAWGSVTTAAIIGIPLGYLTYKLNQDGFSWISLLPGSISGFMLIGALGLLFNRETPSDEPTAESE
jgi:HAMP domain-containing protein